MHSVCAYPNITWSYMHAMVTQENEQAHLRQFVEELVKNSASLMELFDSVICSSEVVPGSELAAMTKGFCACVRVSCILALRVMQQVTS